VDLKATAYQNSLFRFLGNCSLRVRCAFSCGAEWIRTLGTGFYAGRRQLSQVTLSTSAAYLDNWIKALRDDARWPSMLEQLRRRPSIASSLSRLRLTEVFGVMPRKSVKDWYSSREFA
jgi:hypothetical protein